VEVLFLSWYFGVVIMRIFLSFVLAITGIVGVASPAFAAKAPATLKVSKETATQGSKVTITMTAKKFKSKRWYIQVKVNGDWQTFCDGKPKKGKLKCSGTLPLEGTNLFRAECFWCNNYKTVYSSKSKIKGKPASGSPKKPAAKGKFLSLGDDSNKRGDLAVNSVNWNATAEYCARFTNDDVQYEEFSDPCIASSTYPGYSSPDLASWEATSAIPNSGFGGKVIAIGITYLQSEGGSGNVPALKFRQADSKYVDSIRYHPGLDDPVDIYNEDEATIQGVRVKRTAYFEVAKRISSGHVVANDYNFGRFPTRGLYEEAWFATR
jgi:hypothetical protein